MQFCDDCGAMMQPDDGTMVCTSCDNRVAQDTDRAKEFISTAAQDESDVIESSEAANFEGKPRADDITCPECGHGEAWYTIKQTAAADEAPTRFFKCTDCGARWREYN